MRITTAILRRTPGRGRPRYGWSLTLSASPIDAKNPLFTKAVVLKEYFGFSVDEIAEKLGTTKRNIYLYIEEAKKIGRKFKENPAAETAE